MKATLEQELNKLKQGDHICAIYENTAEQTAAAVPFLKEGLARGERGLYVADDHTVETISQALAAAGVAVAQEQERGALWRPTKQDSYLKGGKFDPQAMIDFLRSAQTQALADGFSGLRVVGEMTLALGSEVGCDRLIEFEALLNDFMANSQSTILCQYNRSRFDPTVIHDVLRTHPIAIIGDLVCPNPYYEPPELVLSPDQQASAAFKRKRVGWWIAQVKRARAAEQERERLLEQLKQSERKLAQAQRIAHLGYWEYDLDADRITWSDEACRIMGIPLQSVRTIEEFRQMIHPEDRPRQAEALTKALQDRGAYDVEYRIIRADGELRFIHSIDEVIRDESGRPHRVFGAWQDVTERERTLEQLKQSERRLAEAQQVAHIGSWERDLRTNEVTWSDELYRLFGLQSHQDKISYQRFLSFVVPNDVDRILALMDEAIRERRAFSFDYRINRPDGSVRVLRELGSVIVNAEGEPVRLVGTAQDVTERRRMEEMLEENRRLLHMVLATLPVGVAVTDRAGDIVLVNAACKRIWGDVIVSGGERRARSKGCWHDSGKRIEPESWASARALLEGQTSLNELIDIETFDGQQKTIQNSAAPIRNAEGLILGAVVVNEDATERVRAEEALRESADRLQHLSRRLLEVQEEERRHMARELHDEFGQLLAAITLHLHVARGLAGDAARPRLDECATILQQAGEQVRSLALELRPTMLDTLGLEATLRWLAEQHQQRTGCEVQVVGHLSGAPLSTKLAIACFRVAQEALTNVVRHAAARHVWIELNQSDRVLELVVRDDGVGFDVAPTLEQAARRGSLGMLGMRERVEILRGTLQVESEAGRGTRIRASFPLSEDSEQSADPEE